MVVGPHFALDCKEQHLQISFLCESGEKETETMSISTRTLNLIHNEHISGYNDYELLCFFKKQKTYILYIIMQPKYFTSHRLNNLVCVDGEKKYNVRSK